MHERTQFRKLSVMFATAALSSTAFAQQAGQISLPPDQYRPTGTAEKPVEYTPSGTAAAPVSGTSQRGGIPLGPITAYPSVTAGYQRNDNLYSNPNNKKADTIQLFNPAVRLEAKQATNTYSLNMGITDGRYQTQKEDSFTDYNANALADLDLSTRLRARLRLDYFDSHDPRGSTNTAISPTPDRWRSTYGQGILSYGAPGAKGRFDFELGQTKRDYYNNRVTTIALDRTIDDVGGTFFWRVMPRTSLLFQAKQSSVDYSAPTSTYTSKENSYLAGVTWEATAKTTGVFKLGTLKKDFKDSTRQDTSSTTWNGQIRWSPLTYSHVDFTLIKTPFETTGGVGNYIDKTTTAAVWTHEWSSQFSTALSTSFMNDDYKGISRTDKTQFYGLTATYKMRRWLSFGADYSNTTRDSSDNNFDYKRNLLMLFVRASL